MFGKGLFQGLGITLKYMLKPNITEFYPEVKPNLPLNVRSSMRLEPGKCLACGLCANVCPNKVISLTSKEAKNHKKLLKTYNMDVGRCLFCGMCTEVCPTNALTVTQEFENAIYFPEHLQWDMIKRARQSGKKEG